MRVVLDTNILVSALLVQRGYPAIAARIKPYQAGRLVNALKELAEIIGPLPHVERSPDPAGDFLLALSEAGNADYLVTGYKSGLLSLARHEERIRQTEVQRILI